MPLGADQLLTQLEVVERRYQALFQEKLPAALGEVEAFWLAEGSPLTLPNVAEWHRGNFTPGALARFVAKLPAVTVEATSLVPTDARDATVGVVDSLTATVFVRGASTEQVSDLIQRYTAALGYVIANHKPRGIKAVERVHIEVGEALDFSGAPYVKAGMVTARLHVGAVL
jgi:hypothetical protein